jgi:hypothetical protein
MRMRIVLIVLYALLSLLITAPLSVVIVSVYFMPLLVPLYSFLWEHENTIKDFSFFFALHRVSLRPDH